jgi:hypothetical protein
VFSSTLAIVSSWLDLGIEDAADRLRGDLVAIPDPELHESRGEHDE